MFFDDRINAERGKAFRATLMFAWVASAVYLAIHLIEDFINPASAFLFNSLLVFVIGIGILIAIGEIRFGFVPKDEMLQTKKHKYYTRIFWRALFFFIFTYCLETVFNVFGLVEINISQSYYTKGEYFLLTLETACWVNLLAYLKCREVPLTYRFVLLDKKAYILNVLKNLGKLVFVMLSFIVFTELIYFISFDKTFFDLASNLLKPQTEISALVLSILL